MFIWMKKLFDSYLLHYEISQFSIFQLHILDFVLGKFVLEVRLEKMPVTEMVDRHLYVNRKKAIGML